MIPTKRASSLSSLSPVVLFYWAIVRGLVLCISAEDLPVPIFFFLPVLPFSEGGIGRCSSLLRCVVEREMGMGVSRSRTCLPFAALLTYFTHLSTLPPAPLATRATYGYCLMRRWVPDWVYGAFTYLLTCLLTPVLYIHLDIHLNHCLDVVLE